MKVIYVSVGGIGLSTNKLCKISNITIVITLFLLILCTSNLSIIPYC